MGTSRPSSTRIRCSRIFRYISSRTALSGRNCFTELPDFPSPWRWLTTANIIVSQIAGKLPISTNEIDCTTSPQKLMAYNAMSNHKENRIRSISVLIAISSVVVHVSDSGLFCEPSGTLGESVSHLHSRWIFSDNHKYIKVRCYCHFQCFKVFATHKNEINPSCCLVHLYFSSYRVRWKGCRKRPPRRRFLPPFHRYLDTPGKDSEVEAPRPRNNTWSIFHLN